MAATARNPEQLDDLVAQFGDQIYPIRLDVTDPQAVRAAVAAARQRFGRLNVVVNNAGYANVSPIETADEADVRAQFETNFWGVYHVSKAVIAILREQGGGLIIQSLRWAAAWADPRGSPLPGRQIRHRWVQPGAAR